MIRAVIYTGDSEKSKLLFKISHDAVRAANVGCELSFKEDVMQIMKNLAITPNYYDVIILDSADSSCIKLASAIRKSNLNATVIFVAADEKNIMSLIKFRPSGIITDISDEEQVKRIVRFACYEQMHFRPCFTVRNKDSVMRIPYDSISFFESNQRKIMLNTDKHKIEFYGKLNDIISILPGDQFSRCHQSFIVNLSKVKNLDKVNRCFLLNSGAYIEISKSHYSQVLAHYDEYTQHF